MQQELQTTATLPKKLKDDKDKNQESAARKISHKHNMLFNGIEQEIDSILDTRLPGYNPEHLKNLGTKSGDSKKK